MQVGLYITLEPENGKPITLARVRDRKLLTNAAAAALLEAENTSDEMYREDQVLGQLQDQEVRRLRNALELLLPEIRGLLPGLPEIVM